MTTPFDGSLLWCAAQTLVVAGLGLIAVWMLARRAPASAATVAAAAAATILAVTLLIPAPLPTLAIRNASDIETQMDEATPADIPVADPTPSRASSPWSLYAAEARATLTKFLSVASNTHSPEQDSGISIRRVTVAVLLGSAVLGLGRFALALALVAKLRRQRQPIADTSLQRTFAELRTRLQVRRGVELGESAAIAGPALVGWRRPVVLLPIERTGWTEDQLRATLAHELAHVVRGDFLWRAVARLAVAIHFCQPAVHWLARRLALMQEAATDQLAARAVGGPAAYVRSLSELAIRLDDHTRLRAEPLVLPALSSHLTRRIAMLRSKEGSSAIERRGIGGVLAAALIAIIGASTMALRGAAEPADVAPTAKAAQAFDASPVDWSFMGPAEEGLIVVRPSRMTQRTALAPLTRRIQVAMDTAAAETEKPPTWLPRLEMIDYYAVRMNIAIHADDTGAFAPQEGGSITGDLALRFHDAQVADDFWKQSKATPGAEAADDNGFSYLRTPVEHVGFMHVAKRDAHTFVFSDSLNRLRKMAEHDATSPNDEAAAPWTSLDGGLVTAYGGKQSTEIGVMILASIYPQISMVEQVLGEMLTMLRNDVQSLGFGIDLDPETDECKLHVLAQCNDAAAAQRVRDAVAMLQNFAEVQLNGLTESLKDPTQVQSLDQLSRAAVEGHLCWTRLLADAKVETQPAKDGSVTVTIEAAAPLPQELLTAYLLKTVKPPLVESKK